MSFNEKQVAQLLRPIARQRVLRDGKGNAHVSQQDVTAHLIRVFGFGSFDTEVLDVQCVFERPTLSVKQGAQKPDPNRYDVCYRALLRLTVRDEHGVRVASYEDGSTATALNQTLGDAHDLAYKSALSLSKKRCAINLGDQFGLSLYNKGQMSALVIATLTHPDEHDDAGDVESDVPQQVALGNDEIDTDGGEAAYTDPEPYRTKLNAAANQAELARVGAELAGAGLAEADLVQLRAEYTQRLSELTGSAA